MRTSPSVALLPQAASVMPAPKASKDPCITFFHSMSLLLM